MYTEYFLGTPFKNGHLKDQRNGIILLKLIKEVYCMKWIELAHKRVQWRD